MGARLPRQFHTDPAARVGHPHALRLKSARPAGKTGGRTLEQNGSAMDQDGRKSLTVPMRTKVLDEASGVCEHIVSVFGVVDHGGDRILPGFFAKTLAEKLPKGVWCHDWTIPVAKTLEAMELMPGDERLPDDIRDFGGLYVKAQYNLDTQRGREAFSDVSGGYMDEFSIGFTVTKEAKEKNGVNNLIEGRLFEWSPVLWGMNPLTRHISAKGCTAAQASPNEAKGALSLLAKDGERALLDLREKSMDDDLPAAMTWGALYTANNYLYYELYDAVWGWGEYRDADIETRALMLAECIDSFKAMTLGAFVSLMTLLTQMDEAEDESEEDGLTALGLDANALGLEGALTESSKSAKARAMVTAHLLKRLGQGGGSDLTERALSRLLAEGHKALYGTLKSALSPTPSVAAKSDTDAVGGVPTATPSDTTTQEDTNAPEGAEATTETPAELEKARARAAQVLALTL